jgi:hypothetical protein
MRPPSERTPGVSLVFILYFTMTTVLHAIIASNSIKINESLIVKKTEGKRSWRISKYYPRIRPEELSKPRKISDEILKAVTTKINAFLNVVP